MTQSSQKPAGHDPGIQNVVGAEPKVQQNKETVERVVSGLAGAAFEGIDAVGNGITAIWNFNKSVINTAGQITEPLLKPLDALGVTEMVRRPVDAVVTGVEERVAQLEVKGREGLTQTGSFTILAISDTIDAVLDYISTHPQVDKLINDKLDKFLPMLSESAARTAVGAQAGRCNSAHPGGDPTHPGVDSKAGGHLPGVFEQVGQSQFGNLNPPARRHLHYLFERQP